MPDRDKSTILDHVLGWLLPRSQPTPKPPLFQSEDKGVINPFDFPRNNQQDAPSYLNRMPMYNQQDLEMLNTLKKPWQGV